MARKIGKFIQNIFSQRVIIIAVVFLVMSMVLVARIFDLQVVEGQEYADNFTVMTTRKRMIQGTRGNIYDVNGKLLAYNELSNSVTIEDNGTYETTREKNLSLNGEIYRLINLIRSKGDTVSHNFHIIVDEDGNYAFDVDEGTTRNRFRADIYGHSHIEEMTDEEANASAEQVMDYLSGAKRFAIYNNERPYTAEELASHGLPEELTKEMQLDIVIVRYQLSLISYQRYVPVTVAEDVSDETVAAVEESEALLQGVSIVEDSKRIYNDPIAFAPIIGYTGKPSAEELDELRKQSEEYTSTSIIGKAGIEQYMEMTLQGKDGSEDITVDNLGKVLAINENSRVEPTQGNDVYLTIDSELQNACYQILEQRIAGILLKKIVNQKHVNTEIKDPDNDLFIPIYDVYNSLINNSILDINRFSQAGASDTEKKVQDQFEARRKEVIDWIYKELTGNGTPYQELGEEEQRYLDYICSDYLLEETGILNVKKMNSDDETYRAWFTDQSISFSDFLHYAATEDWIDITKLEHESTYMDSNEVFLAVVRNLTENLTERSAFSRIIYRYMLLDDRLDPRDLCQILYDQEILNENDDIYASFQAGNITPFNLITSKIRSLEITPAQLALDPCSGSIVINDPDTGEVRALVTYPGYDNNRLANEMDTAYYNKLYRDLSTPFYNKATQQLTAPGSTYKPIMAAAGLNEQVIDLSTQINCTGLFGEELLDKSDQLHCWLHTGHGSLDVVGGIENSCNVYFCTIAYRLGLGEDKKFSQSRALAKIQKYTDMFNLDQKTNVQINESSPHVTDDLPIPSAIGQGTHQYTTAQLSRLAATICNDGTSYDLNLLSKVTNPDGVTVESYSPKIAKKANLPDHIWSSIHTGMQRAMSSNELMKELPIEVYGKTGTAQEANNRPSHALVIGHCTDKEGDEIAYAVRIAFGYSSRNALLVARDTLHYYYDLEDEAQILIGKAADDDISNQAVTD